ncbi:hypothetical protein ACFIOZ_12180 [Vreelandella sp. F11]|uniref:hypothetical protein n=1 Tax=Vreelandella sp. F11 TaxID=3394751 RepID=UPI0036D8A843
MILQLNLKSIAACAVFFALVGPPVGALTLTPLLLLGEVEKHGFSFQSAFYLWLLTTIFAYIFGIIPALLTGLIRGALHKCSDSWIAAIGIGIVGLFLSILFGGTIYYDSTSIATLLIMFGMPGLVAGIVCTIIYGAKNN